MCSLFFLVAPCFNICKGLAASRNLARVRRIVRLQPLLMMPLIYNAAAAAAGGAGAESRIYMDVRIIWYHTCTFVELVFYLFLCLLCQV